jgi:hypothetical protein
MDKNYILTAELDDESFAWLDGLRREHFPPERNLLRAHLTLFHRLSPAQWGRLGGFDIPSAPVAILVDSPALLGSSVAMRIRSTGLERLRAAARLEMGGQFSRQDNQPWRPHVTVQNKVSADAARRLHLVLTNDFVKRAGVATGLLVWEYLGGPWKLAERIGFGCNV